MPIIGKTVLHRAHDQDPVLRSKDLQFKAMEATPAARVTVSVKS
jgi:hypothetical protein